MSNSQNTNDPRRKHKDQKRFKRPSRVSKKTYPLKSQTQTGVEDIRIDLEEGTYIVFDIETTGGNPERNGITEIYAVRYEQGEVKDSFYSMVNPRVPIPSIVRRMTGITNKMVRHAPLIAEVMPDFVKFIGNHILVSHNTIGDLKFLVHFAKTTCGHQLQNFFLCTHLLTEKLLPETPDKSLQGLGKYFGLQQGPVHRAKEDTHLTLELFKILVGKLKQQGIDRIEDAIRLQGDMDSGLRTGWALREDVVHSLPSTPGILRLFDRKDKEIFLGSSFNVKRSFSSLEHYHTQPRQLQRVILQSYRIEYESYSHIYAAMLAEAGLNHAKLSLRYQPYQWHLRFIPVISIKKESDDSIRVAVSSLTSGVVEAFGPVHDKKAAQALIENLAKIFGVAVSRKGMVLPAKKKGLLSSYLKGSLQEERQKFKKSYLDLKCLFSSAYRKELMKENDELKKLLHLPKIPELSLLMQEHGVIVAPREGDETWDLYPVVAGRPGSPTLVEGDWRQWLQSTQEGQDFMARLQEKIANFAPKPLSRKEAQKVNATLWVIYAGKGKKPHQCTYWSLQDLTKI